MATTTLGKVSLTTGGVYNANATYDRLTMVLGADGCGYVSRVSGVTGVEPGVAANWQTYWMRIAERGSYTLTNADKEEIAGMIPGMAIVAVQGTDPEITAATNTLYECGELYTLDFAPSATGICAVRFTSGATPTVLSGFSGVTWPEWFVPSNLDANATYELSIESGTWGAVMVW